MPSYLLIITYVFSFLPLYGNENPDYYVRWLCPVDSNISPDYCLIEAIKSLQAVGCVISPMIENDNKSNSNKAYVVYKVTSTNCLNNEDTQNILIPCPPAFSSISLETWMDTTPFFQWQNNRPLQRKSPNRVCKKNTGQLMF